MSSCSFRFLEISVLFCHFSLICSCAMAPLTKRERERERDMVGWRSGGAGYRCAACAVIARAGLSSPRGRPTRSRKSARRRTLAKTSWCAAPLSASAGGHATRDWEGIRPDLIEDAVHFRRIPRAVGRTYPWVVLSRMCFVSEGCVVSRRRRKRLELPRGLTQQLCRSKPFICKCAVARCVSFMLLESAGSIVPVCCRRPSMSATLPTALTRGHRLSISPPTYLPETHIPLKHCNPCAPLCPCAPPRRPMLPISPSSYERFPPRCKARGSSTIK